MREDDRRRPVTSARRPPPRTDLPWIGRSDCGFDDVDSKSFPARSVQHGAFIAGGCADQVDDQGIAGSVAAAFDQSRVQVRGLGLGDVGRLQVR
jgi:hypothetical protein